MKPLHPIDYTKHPEAQVLNYTHTIDSEGRDVHSRELLYPDGQRVFLEEIGELSYNGYLAMCALVGVKPFLPDDTKLAS